MADKKGGILLGIGGLLALLLLRKKAPPVEVPPGAVIPPEIEIPPEEAETRIDRVYFKKADYVPPPGIGSYIMWGVIARGTDYYHDTKLTGGDWQKLDSPTQWADLTFYARRWYENGEPAGEVVFAQIMQLTNGATYLVDFNTKTVVKA